MSEEIRQLDVGKIKLQWRGTYNGATAYEVDDVVLYDDAQTTSAYIAVANGTGNTPSTSGAVNTTYWNLMARGAQAASEGDSDGQVQFKSSTGFGATSSLFYDSSNNRLGINTDVPTTSLQVVGILTATTIDHSYSSYESSFNLLQRDTSTTNTFSETVNIEDSLKAKSGIVEKVNIVNGTANGTSNIDVMTATTWYFDTASTGDWTHNIRGDGSTSLDSLMSTGDNIVVCVISTQNNSSYGSVNINIDGAGQTEYWIDNDNNNNLHGADGYDLYFWNITKTGSSSYIVTASSNNYT